MNYRKYMQKKIWTMFAAFVAVGAFAGEAVAIRNTIDPQTLGAAVAIPWMVDDQGSMITVATITNTMSDDPITLHVTWISDTWSAVDRDCALTPMETTYFVFEQKDNDESKVTFECSELGAPPLPTADKNLIKSQSIAGFKGIMFVALECQMFSPGCPNAGNAPRTRYHNALLGDSTVIDFAQGTAFSVSGIHIQGTGNSADNDRLYRFDGDEYLNFPSSLTTSYIAPDDDITLELFLFTLDGTLDESQPLLVQAEGMAFDDDENDASGRVKFDCMFFGEVNNQPPNGWTDFIQRDVTGHLVGHIEMFSKEVSNQRDLNELQAPTGNASSVRKRPFHGWVIQTFAAGGVFDDGNFPDSGDMIAANAVWARTLVQSTHPFMPEEKNGVKDVPALNAN